MKRILAILFPLLLAAGAGAADLDQAKRDGLIGERADGLLGLVREDAPDDIVTLVAEVNEKRRAEYQRIASSNGISFEEVQALAGKKAIERTAAGGFILQNGGWQKK